MDHALSPSRRGVKSVSSFRFPGKRREWCVRSLRHVTGSELRCSNSVPRSLLAPSRMTI